MPITAALVGTAIGALKSEAIDRPAANRKRHLAAQTNRYSPWTGMKGENVQDPDTVANMLSYGSQGAMMGQGMNSAAASNELAKQQADFLKKGNLWGSMGGGNGMSMMPATGGPMSYNGQMGLA